MKIITTDNNPFVRLVDEVYLPCAEGDEGAIANPNLGQTTTEEIPDPPAVPLTLLNVQFAEHAWSKLGGGDVGMARLQAILDDAYAAGGAPKAASKQLDRLTSITVAQATTLLGAIRNGGFMAQEEVDAICGDSWPTDRGSDAE